MRRNSPAFLRVICASFPVLFLCGLLAQTAPKHSVLDGVYTDAQATRGELAYTKTCAECHDLSFDGTPVEGEGFIDNWREFPLQTLYDYISTTMPEDNPGELSKDSYRDVVAYLLRRNGYPKGQTDLTEAVIKATAMVGLDGPKPLASDTMVRVAGCATPAADNSWDLAQSGDPVRIRKPEPASPGELQSAAAEAPGTQKLKLLNLDNLEPKFVPDSFKAQRVLVKGVLVKDSYGARISAMTLDKLGASCR
jgi:S-disulfanyl-L-cysteine oxidoreductase SoxD